MRSRAAVLLLAVVVLAGCGGSGGTSTVTVDGAGTPAAGPRTTTGPEAGASGASGATRAAGTRPALAERTGNVDGAPVRLEIAELKRANGTTSLQLRLTTTTTDNPRIQVAQTFDDGISQKVSDPDAAGSVKGAFTLDGIYLVDGANRKKYRVGRDAEGICTCDTELQSAFVTPDAPLTLSATFGAPPPEVRKVDVFVPRFGTFKDVPLG